MRPPGSRDELIVGRLMAHGRDHYRFQIREPESYYLKLKTSRGERVLWGADLERALLTGATQPKIGEMVGARRLRREPVSMPGAQLAYRNLWRVETLQWFTDRAKLARRIRDEQLEASKEIKAHPELRSAYLTLRGAEDIAARKIRNPEDRVQFVALVKEAMACSVKRGEALPSVRLKESRSRRTAIKKDEPTR